MAKLNAQATIKTTNLAGGVAYNIVDAKVLLMTQVLTSFFKEPKYYGDNSNDIVKNIRLVVSGDPEFVAKLAVYAREDLYMRSISHVLLAELANCKAGRPYVRRTAGHVIQRPDDMTEVLAYYISNFGRNIPVSLEKGIADGFRKFDAYQLAKYNRDNAVKLKDALCLSHAKPHTAEQGAMWKQLLENILPVPYTWETELSTKGASKKVWEELIDSQRVGYMAALRNIRNVLDSGASNVDKLLEYLVNPKAVANSKQLPFRFYSAYKALASYARKYPKVNPSLEAAMELSVINMPKWGGKTFFTADGSGSMEWSTISKNSELTYKDLAYLLMAIADKFCDDAIVSVFATDFAVGSTTGDNKILHTVDSFKHRSVGGGTELWKPLKWLLDNKVYVDRIVIMSDMQVYGSSSRMGNNPQQILEQYKRTINPNVWVHSMDLAGHGTQQFVGKNTNLLAGWSDKILEFIPLAEAGAGGIMQRIESKNL